MRYKFDEQLIKQQKAQKEIIQQHYPEATQKPITKRNRIIEEQKS